MNSDPIETENNAKISIDSLSLIVFFIRYVIREEWDVEVRGDKNVHLDATD